MNLKFVHLYPDLMSLYGEWANIALLRRHFENLGHTVTMAYDGANIAGADFVFLGAGTERSQKTVLEHIRRCQDSLARAMEQDAPMLFTGTAMDLLGQEIVDAKGQRFEGLGLADFTSEETGRRIVGDVIGACGLTESPVVGFMNKCSLVRGTATPFLTRCDMGFGNEAERGAEGYWNHCLLGTHLTGPLLVKNPALTRFFVETIYRSRGESFPDRWPEYPYEEQGYQVTVSELRKLAGK